MSDTAPQMTERGLGNVDVEHEQRDREREHPVAERLRPIRIPAITHLAPSDARHRCSCTPANRSSFADLGGPDARSRAQPPALQRQLHFDLLVSTKLLTELTTLPASSAIAAIWLADGLDGSALTALSSVSTDVFTALVSDGKSLLAAFTSDVASFLMVVT